MICSRHFVDEDFVTVSQDSNEYRQVKTSVLKNRRLKDLAVPSKFENCPSYLSKKVHVPRSVAATSSTRHEKEIQRQDEENEEFLMRDQVSSLDELETSIKEEKLPAGICIIRQEQVLMLTAFGQNSLLCPEISFGVIISEDMSFKMFCNQVPIPQTSIHHITRSEKIEQTSVALNIIAHLKNLSQGGDDESKAYVQFLLSALEEITRTCDSFDDDMRKKLEFSIEQMRLCLKKKESRRYSPSLLACAMMWNNTSSSLYKQMLSENILCLPTIRHLQNLSSSISMNTGLTENTVLYLKARAKNLNDYEKNVLLIDEIYTAQKIEYHNGKVTGYKD